MTAGALLAELHDLGAVAYRIGDKIRLRPAAVLTPELLARVKAQKADLLRLLPPSPPRDHRDSCDGTCDDAGVGRIGCDPHADTPTPPDTTPPNDPLTEILDGDSRAALLWWYRQGHPEIADEESSVLRRLDKLGMAPDVRADLLRLVDRVRELRDAYWRAREWGAA